MAGSLGSGSVQYNEHRPIVHFGNAHEVSYRPTEAHDLIITKDLPHGNYTAR